MRKGYQTIAEDAKVFVLPCADWGWQVFVDGDPRTWCDTLSTAKAAAIAGLNLVRVSEDMPPVQSVDWSEFEVEPIQGYPQQ
jgi:hypothetical protein